MTVSNADTQHAHGARRLLDAVAHWADTIPAATAVHAADGRFDFVGLDATATRIAERLRAHGAGPGVGVGLRMGRSRWQVAALLAVWRAGAVAVPTDDRHPPERIDFVLRDADVALVLAPGSAEPAGPRRAQVLDPTADDGPPPARRRGSASPDVDLAYIVYTSGTTGWPKGVEITHDGFAAFLAALSGLRLEPGGTGINAVSPAFDGWLWCTCLYLLHGQAVALVSPTDGDRTGDLSALVAEVGATTVCLTPSLLAACADDLPGVSTLVVAGEPCPAALAERFAVGRRLLNVYGPTEATIAATWADSARGDDVTTIGRPLPGYHVHVLGPDLRPVATGGTGELHLGGPALARGYRGRPDLTASGFIDGGGLGRLYRTGDLVRARTDGQLVHLGRLDEQTKVRGVRLELGEVEAVAMRHDAVRAAAAFVVGGDVLQLAVVAPGAGPDIAAAVRELCARTLPVAAVPSAVFGVDGLPTTPAGKIDRAALATTCAGLAIAAAGRAPATATERLVCAVWDELLADPVRDIDANFFDIGGHSLLAARAVVALRRASGSRLTMRDLLAHPTVAELAAVLDGVSAVEPAAQARR